MLQLTTEVTYAGSTLLYAGVGAVYDVRTHRIPNFLTLPGIAFGLILHFMLGGWRQVGAAGAAGLLCGLIFVVFYLGGGMGAGDVKLITAAGCISGLSLVGPLLIWTSLAGGSMALAIALYHHKLKETFQNAVSLVVHHGTEGLKVHPELNLGNASALRLPYALAIAVGSLLTFCRLVAAG